MLSSGPRTIPGGWGKDLQSEGRPAYSDLGDDVSTNELAVGVVNEAGEVLNDADEPVGKIEEGEPEYIVGGIVNASGEVLGKSGDVVGKAAPLDDASEKAPGGAVTKGGWTVIGTVKSVTDVLGAAAGKTGKTATSSSRRNEEQEDEQSVLETQSKSPIDLEDKEKDFVSEKAETTPDQDTPATDRATSAADSNSQVSKATGNNADKTVNDATSRLSNIPEETASKLGTAADEPSQVGTAAEEEPEEFDSQAPEELGSQAPDDGGSVVTRDFAEVEADDSISQVGSKKSGTQASKAGEELPEGEEPPEGDLPAEEGDDNKTQASKTGSAAKSQATGSQAGSKVGSQLGSKAGSKAGTGLLDTLSQRTKSVASTFGSQYMRDEEAWDPLAKPFEKFEGAVVGEDGRIMLEDESIGVVADGDVEALAGKQVNAEGDIVNETGTVVGKAELKEELKEQILEEAGTLDFSALAGAKVNKAGNLVNDNGDVVGRVIQGNLKLLYGKECDENGLFFNDKGKEIGKAEPIPEAEKAEEASPFEDFPDAYVESNGDVIFNGEVIGKVVEGDPKKLKGKKVDKDGDIVDKNGNVLGHAERWEPEAEAEPEKLDTSILKGAKVNKAGNLVNDKGETIGRVVEGVLKQLIGKRCDENGLFYNEMGQQIGRAELIPEKEREEFKEPSPFEDFPGAVVEANGDVVFNGEVVGKLVEGDPKKLRGKHVDDDGDILDKNGNVVGRAERWEAPEAEPEPEKDLSILKGAKVNKAGNLVNDKGEAVGRLVEGVLKNLIGKHCDEKGQFWNDEGHVIGRAEPIPDSEREAFKEPAPFEDFPDSTVQSNGDVVSGGEVIGKVVSGDPKKLKGKKVDDDGDILDRSGNVLGHAERWEAPEEEAEPEKDLSILAGKRVNKVGNVVDSSGVIYGRLVEGDAKRLAGRMCDKDGNVRSESGDILGRADTVSEGEREGLKEGPFAELPGCTVNKEGKVVTPGGDVVGRLVTGDAKVLFGRSVDEDGDVLDRNGNSIGKAERWDEPVEEKKKGPMAGRRVNREGEVVDDDGNIIGRLTSGDVLICSGKEIDDDGDVVNSKGQTIGHVSLLEEIPPEPEVEEGETDEERREREQLESDRDLAQRIAACVEQSLDRIRPICKMITHQIEKAERTPEDERDEEALVREVKPLLEEGGRILQEANGVIRGLDPDGRIQANAKHKTATREASPEEYHLADVLKELTGTITECIENAKRKIEDMPHASKELSPLWGLLTEPLFQILAAVGLLLAGVLGLVGRLLSGLGLGGLLDGLLGNLGLTRILEKMGVGSVVGALTGKGNKKK